MFHLVSYTLIKKYMELIKKKPHLEGNFWVVLQIFQILTLVLCGRKVPGLDWIPSSGLWAVGWIKGLTEFRD